jgi:hypothetical protein
MTDAKPRPLFWLAAFVGLEGLVVGLVFYLVGVVSGLQRQAVLVLTGTVVFAAVWWLLARVETKPNVRAGEQGPIPAKDIFWILATQLMAVIWLIYGLNVNSVGERMWWLCAVGLPLGIGFIIYHLVDLYRHRHEHARQREEKWAPWG